MNFKRGMALAGCVAALVGCGGPGSFDGTVAGQTLNVEDAIFGNFYDDQGRVAGATVLLSDKPDLCNMLKTGREPKDAAYALFLLLRTDGQQLLAPDVGNYTVTADLTSITNGNYGIVAFGKNNSTCNDIVSGEQGGGRTGTVKVSSLKASEGGQLKGTFDVSFGPQGDKATGDFTADYCELRNAPAEATACQ